MNKIFTKIGTAMVGLAMAIGVGVAIGKNDVKEVKAAPSGAITNVSNIVSGNTYYVGATVSNNNYYFKANGGTAVTTANVAGTSVNNKTDATPITFTSFEKNSKTYWYLQFVNGNYMHLPANNGKYLVAGEPSGTSQDWTIENDTTNSLLKLKNNNRMLERNSNASNFGSYANDGQTNVWLVSAGFKVTYNANGATSGTVPTDSNGYDNNATVTVKANTGNLARGGYDFVGWNTQANGQGTDYAASGSATFNITSNITLYAKWSAKELDNISLSGTYKTVFWQNSTFSSDGLVVTANYKGGDSEAVTAESITGYNLTNKGKQTVTVTFNEKTASYYIYVVERLNTITGQSASNNELYNISAQGYESGDAVESYSGTYFSATFEKGTNSNNAPKYYDNNVTVPAIRMYGGNKMTISSTYKITGISISFGDGENTNEITTNVGSYTAGSYSSSTSGTWTGEATSVCFTIGGTSNNRRFASITVTVFAPTQYQQQDIDAQAALMQFVEEFNKELGTTGTGNTGICKTDGSTNLEALATAWGSAESGLYKLFVDKRNGLAEAKRTVFDNMVKYATPDADGDSLQKALSLYDHLVVNRSMSDFLNTISGRGAASLSNESVKLNNAVDNGNMLMVVVISSAFVTSLALGGFFFLRKRKELR